MSHTPPPWKAGKPQWNRGGPPYKIPISGPNGTIANVLTHDVKIRDSEPWVRREPDEPNDDARLIAAAPELVECVDDLLNWALMHPESHVSCDKAFALLDRIRGKS